MEPQAIAMAKFGQQKTIENRMRVEAATIDRKINISKSSNHFNDNDMLKHASKDGAFTSKTNIGQERSVHRQLKTFYGQGTTTQQPLVMQQNTLQK